MTDSHRSDIDSKHYIEFKRYIQSAGLSVRAKNVILENCFSLEDLTSLDSDRLYAFRNCGKKTVYEIIQFIKIIREEGAVRSYLSIKEQLSEPPTESSISILPLFSEKKSEYLSEDLTIQDLHPKFQATIKLSDVFLSSRTAKVLKTCGFETLGEVMLTPASILLEQKNFGRKSLRELREIVQSFCLEGPTSLGKNLAKSPEIDYSSYEAMISTFIEQCEQDTRNQKLLMDRFCFRGGKVPTLEELGQRFGISRERVRQILKKGTAKFQIKTFFDKLAHFWECLDRIITRGGGILHLGALPSILQAEFTWPNPPYYLALGQLLLLRYPNNSFKKKEDLVQVECQCLSCDFPGKQLQTIDFESKNSFHIDVVAATLSDYCKKNCPWNNPVTTFHRAFIERLVEQSNYRLVLQNDLVLTHEKWISRYSKSLESIITHILERHGTPMHFSKIAEEVRDTNITYRNASDHSIHSALLRYDSIVLTKRGTYGLKSWGVGGYRSVSKAIESVIDANGLPMRSRDIVRALVGKFKQGNIYAALSGWKNRFTNIGDGFYDRTSTWQQRTLQQLIQLLPDKVAEFAQYLVGRNNTSYKLVMAFVFIRSMDEDGSIYVNKLKDMFYNFYLSRLKKGLVVELDSSVISRIAEMPPAVIKNNASKEPIKSFLNSDFFQEYSQNGARIKIVDHLVAELREGPTRDTLLITILKAIDEYFLKINPTMTSSRVSSPTEVVEPQQELSQEKPETGQDQHPSSIIIKKKRRGKIKL